MTEYVDRRTHIVDASCEDVFAVLCALGGERGWYSARWLWRLRAFLDRLFGGPGLAPRRHPEQVEVGDLIDFWRVTAIESPTRLRMLTEMKMPGVGILEFEVAGVDAAVDPSGASARLTQTATFAAKGLVGHAYWICLLPVHLYIFKRMIDGVARAAEGERETAGR